MLSLLLLAIQYVVDDFVFSLLFIGIVSGQRLPMLLRIQSVNRLVLIGIGA
jgi:hypothetical protein